MEHIKVYQFYYVICLISSCISIFFIADYREWKVSRTESIQHNGGYGSLFYLILCFSSFLFLKVEPSDPFKDESTYITDYMKHQAAMRQAIRLDQAVLQSQEPFDDRTAYRTDYIRHPQQERFQPPKEEHIPNKSTL